MYPLSNARPKECVAASIELMPKQALEDLALNTLVPKGTRVYIPDIGTDSTSTIVAAARRLSDIGYVAVPHIAARRLPNITALEERVERLAHDAGVRDLLLIGGDVDRPQGPFSDTIEVLETGILERAGITHIGVSGHPEGHRGFSEQETMAVLKAKQNFAERTSAEFRIVTQFGFDPDRVIAWITALQSYGINLPVHLGVAGPAKISTLLKFAAVCGVGNSLNFLKKRGSALATLATGYSPERLVARIEDHFVASPASTLAQIHIFPFGGLKQASEWLEKRGSWS